MATVAQTILAIGKSHQLQVEFRDQVLFSSRIGRRMLKLFHQCQATLWWIALRNPTMMVTAIRLWLDILHFVQATVAIGGGAKGQKIGQQKTVVRYSQKTHAGIMKLIQEFQSKSSDKKLHKALNEVQEELGHYVGLTPKDALKKLRRKRK